MKEAINREHTTVSPMSTALEWASPAQSPVIVLSIQQHADRRTDKAYAVI